VKGLEVDGLIRKYPPYSYLSATTPLTRLKRFNSLYKESDVGDGLDGEEE